MSPPVAPGRRSRSTNESQHPLARRAGEWRIPHAHADLIAMWRAGVKACPYCGYPFPPLDADDA